MAPPKKYWISKHEEIPEKSMSIFNEYLLSLKLENKAEATVSKYRKLLEKFLSECNSLEDLTSEHVLEWLNEFSQKKSPRTIDLMLSSLSSFFTFCLTEDYMERVVIKNRWRPKIPMSLPKYLDETEYALVKMTAEQLSLRDRALVLFLFSSGCRRFEVPQLFIKDVDLDKRTVGVRGKGKKIRHTHFSEESALVLKDYLRTRPGDPLEPLFINKFGQVLGQNSIYKITTKLGRMAGLKRTLHPHSFRHTFATNMLARGAPLQLIADEMGHKDLTTTQVYARIPTEDMIIAYQNIMG